MTNPVHLLVTPQRAASVPRLIIALGQTDRYLSPHLLYLALGKDDETRQASHRSLFRAASDKEAISDLRLALNQNQPLGSSRFYAKVEAMTGQRREPKPRGRPGKQPDELPPVHDVGQGKLPV